MSKIILFCGPTASGKSALALQTAQELGGEIVSADSMQLYRDLPIGTAQPTPAERAMVPHHLTGIFELDRRADVFDYCRRADEVIKDIVSRGKVPVVCGGTGLYIRALICGMDDLPADPALRRELDRQYDFPEAMEALKARMAEVDPIALARWHDCQRKLIRALEVKLICGKSIIELQQGFAGKRRYQAEIRLLDPESSVLKEKIYRRCLQMLANGWIEETEAAVAKGLFETPTAHQALGYKQIAAYLQGSISKEELPEKISTATWQYARRQRTWFRHQQPEPDIILN